MSGSLPQARHGKIGGLFAEGATLTNGANLRVVLELDGAKSARVRFRAAVAGTLSAAFVRPGQPTSLAPADLAVYAADNPADVVVTANADAKMDIVANGEKQIRLTFLPSATGLLTFADLMIPTGV